jgi:hypothetical protein
MLGLSATKLVLLIVVIGAVIFGTRLLRSLGSSGSAGRRPPEEPRQPPEVTTFKPCPRCGAYVDPAHHKCGGGDGRTGGRGAG